MGRGWQKRVSIKGSLKREQFRFGGVKINKPFCASVNQIVAHFLDELIFKLVEPFECYPLRQGS